MFKNKGSYYNVSLQLIVLVDMLTLHHRLPAGWWRDRGAVTGIQDTKPKPISERRLFNTQTNF